MRWKWDLQCSFVLRGRADGATLLALHAEALSNCLDVGHMIVSLSAIRAIKHATRHTTRWNFLVHGVVSWDPHPKVRKSSMFLLSHFFLSLHDHAKVLEIVSCPELKSLFCLMGLAERNSASTDAETWRANQSSLLVASTHPHKC